MTTETSVFELTPQERMELPKLPGALRALADFHNAKSCQADGMDMPDSARWHLERGTELLAEAERIEKEWEDG